ncbi:cystathionine beta-lyase [Dysgonomonas sp. PFB1-18]|uniref:MalY/PatB family protein n=1 Tax=unclassified Dysgonomonas TaxID=2630389 RepID=UPI0024763815|nr:MULTISPECIES: PatB family C-S lyase [unclassified Dysgonomonas]MDH6307594.1 cystathionine beta-lyase [Dysgonomonas sp. PF1-14]MDH6337512.1 cystathionine beta-lyase [Dysgonomonas sp. PF1-16]MDH6378737.1 cystathionine beta-lyase [Dysgonomonas sp. PFB1-18]MDH6399155.1 cystathionine beta-lyase [Dysgonomonas sp. PF1-23]
MPKYNFDEIVNRKGTNALKTDALEPRYGNPDLIPLWVADMDFKSPPAITEAIIERAKHGIFGYTCASQAYYDAIINWMSRHHDWKIQQEWITFIPGIVKGIAFVVDCFSSVDHKVIIQPPVYHPFRIIPNLHHRTVVDNPLILEAGQYRMDIEGLKNLIDPACRILILCNPHNPGGRVWTRQELADIAEICYDNNILVISDEIHSDLAFAPHKHIPFASVSDKAAQNSITFMAPSKTFNIAGIVSSFSVIPNKELREKFHAYLSSSELEEGHIFAYLAAQAAYDHGGEWLAEAKDYIRKNITFVDEYLKVNIPQIKAMIPEASFLIWLDCRELNMSQKELVSFFVDDAKLALNDGTMFGQGGEGYMRMNVGTPLVNIQKALDNLKKALETKQIRS